jgi:flagellar basal body rod protein FlgG
VANPGGQRLGTLLQGYEEQSNVNIVRSPSA